MVGSSISTTCDYETLRITDHLYGTLTSNTKDRFDFRADSIVHPCGTVVNAGAYAATPLHAVFCFYTPDSQGSICNREYI